jgi:alpha-L-fucosidase
MVDRVVEGRFQNYLTPGNMIPDKPVHAPWESNLVSGGGYSYVSGAKYLSGDRLIRTLLGIAAKGGNLLLNIAPGHLGDFDPDAYRMLREIGEWMKINSEGIYNIRINDLWRQNESIYFTREKEHKALLIIYLRPVKGYQIELMINDITIKAKSKNKILSSNTKVTRVSPTHTLNIVNNAGINLNSTNKLHITLIIH